MTVPAVLATAGVIAIVLGFWGGGVKVVGIEIPLAALRTRVIVVILGCLFLGISIWLFLLPPTGSPEGASTSPISTQENTETASPPEPSTTLTPAPRVLLQDDFIDNRNGWFLPNDSIAKSDIIGGQYKLTINCPQTYVEFYCRNDIKVPGLSSKDLQLELDATMKNMSPSTEVMIIFQFRVIDSNNYYSVYFRSIGKYKINRFYNAISKPLLEETTIPDFSPNTDTTNRYGFYADNTFFKPLFNRQELLAAQDNAIDRGGSVNIVIFVSKGGSATVELDNLIATDRSK